MPTTMGRAPEGLPSDAKRIWVSAFNAAYKKDKDDKAASRIAWSAVKAKYRKAGDSWVLKSRALDEVLAGETPGMLHMFITKASHIDGQRRFNAVWSDTQPDTHPSKARMTPALFESFIKHSRLYGMPYVSIAHYTDLGGVGVAGGTEEMYQDGGAFKVKGAFADTPVGLAAYDAVVADIEAELPDAERIRFSIGFWDLQHYHPSEDYLFTRSTPADECPLCNAGIKGFYFQEGILEHGALTRVPYNERASISLEEGGATVRSAIATMRQDAASIIGEELAAELDEKAKEEASARRAVSRAMWMPLGGAVSVAAARQHLVARGASVDDWSLFQSALLNLLDETGVAVEPHTDAIKVLVTELRAAVAGPPAATEAPTTEDPPMHEAFQSLVDALGTVTDPATLTDENRSQLAGLLSTATQARATTQTEPTEPTPPAPAATPEVAGLADLITAVSALTQQQADTNALLQRLTPATRSAAEPVVTPQRRSVAASPLPAAPVAPAEPVSPIRALARRTVYGTDAATH